MEPAETKADTKYCSNCKRDINAATFELHESHCKRHFHLCPECDEVVPNVERQSHFAEYHALVSCDLCGEMVAKDTLDEHKEQLCGQRLLQCKYCELEVKSVDYDQHTESCGSRTDQCQLCQQRVMLKDMDEHRMYKCNGGSFGAEGPLDPHTLRELAGIDQPPHPLPPPPYTAAVGGGAGAVHLSQGHNITFDGGLQPYAVTRTDQTQVGITPLSPRPAPPPPYVSRQTVNLDPLWVQTVANVCGEEELDDLLAQNLFAENMREATSRDEYHGIGDDVIQEGLQANRERQHLEHQNNNDEDIARRLQNEFDSKARDEQRDVELARQLQQQQQEQQGKPLPPPLVTPVQPASSSSSSMPPAPRALLPVAGGRGDPLISTADDDAALALRLQENEMDFNQRIYKSGQTGYSNQSGSGGTSQGLAGLSDEALARQLQENELAPKFHQEGYQNHAGPTRPVQPQQATTGSFISDEDFARQLQSSDLNNTNPHFPHSVPSYQLGPPPTSQLPQYSAHYPHPVAPPASATQQPAMEESKLHQGRVNPPTFNLTDQEKDVVRHSSRETHLQSSSSTIESDAELALKLQEQYSSATTTTTASLTSDSASDNCRVAPSDFREAQNLYSSSSETAYGNETEEPGAYYHDDEDQPRSKHQSKRPSASASVGEDETVKIPCQYCGELYPKETIMYHQQYHCSASRDHPPRRSNLEQAQPSRSNLEPAQPRRSNLEPAQPRRSNLEQAQPWLQPNTQDPEPHDDLQPTARGGTVPVCRFCGQRQTQALLGSHEALCTLNPDKNLKDVYSSSGGGGGLSHCTLPGSSLDDRGHAAIQMHHSTSDIDLPCQFCEKGFPSSSLAEHQAVCFLNPLHQAQIMSHDSHVTSSITPLSVEKAPCEKCGDMIPLDGLIRHETMCKKDAPLLPLPLANPHPSAPPTTSSSAAAPKKRPIAIRFPQQEASTSSARSALPQNGAVPLVATALPPSLQDQSSTLVVSNSNAFAKQPSSESATRALDDPPPQSSLSESFDPETPLSERYLAQPIMSPGVYQASSQPHTLPAATASKRPTLDLLSFQSSDFQPSASMTDSASFLPPETPTEFRQDLPLHLLQLDQSNVQTQFSTEQQHCPSESSPPLSLEESSDADSINEEYSYSDECANGIDIDYSTEDEDSTENEYDIDGSDSTDNEYSNDDSVDEDVYLAGTYNVDEDDASTGSDCDVDLTYMYQPTLTGDHQDTAAKLQELTCSTEGGVAGPMALPQQTPQPPFNGESSEMRQGFESLYIERVKHISQTNSLKATNSSLPCQSKAHPSFSSSSSSAQPKNMGIAITGRSVSHTTPQSKRTQRKLPSRVARRECAVAQPKARQPRSSPSVAASTKSSPHKGSPKQDKKGSSKQAKKMGHQQGRKDGPRQSKQGMLLPHQDKQTPPHQVMCQDMQSMVFTQCMFRQQQIMQTRVARKDAIVSARQPHSSPPVAASTRNPPHKGSPKQGKKDTSKQTKKGSSPQQGRRDGPHHQTQLQKGKQGPHQVKCQDLQSRVAMQGMIKQQHGMQSMTVVVNVQSTCITSQQQGNSHQAARKGGLPQLQLQASPQQSKQGASQQPRKNSQHKALPQSSSAADKRPSQGKVPGAASKKNPGKGGVTGKPSEKKTASSTPSGVPRPSSGRRGQVSSTTGTARSPQKGAVGRKSKTSPK